MSLLFPPGLSDIVSETAWEFGTAFASCSFNKIILNEGLEEIQADAFSNNPVSISPIIVNISVVFYFGGKDSHIYSL